MKENSPITIGVLAKQASVGVETIRFYERKGLIQQPLKTGGFRHYSDNDIRVVRLIKKLQGVGFSLDEIKDFLALDGCCGDSKVLIREKSLAKAKEVEQKINDLKQVVKALETFACTCGNETNKVSNCDLLDCFENNWECCR